MAQRASRAFSSRVARRGVRRVLRWALWSAFAVLVCGAVAGAILLRHPEPLLKARIVKTLSARFDSRVQLDQLHVSVERGIHVSGGGLRISPRRFQARAPLFAVAQFSFSIPWRQLFQLPMVVDRVQVRGLDINIPPKEERAKDNHSKQNKFHLDIRIDEIVCENATLVIGTNKPGRVPLEFDIGQLLLFSVGPSGPMKFHAVLVNPKPIGNIDSDGSFGPFQADSPGDSPVSGEYRFSNADLNPLEGIGGTLSSRGKYHGVLNSITVDGETSTPNFQLDIASHPVPLNTTFHAIVDGTNGDTYLDPVDARLLHSHIVAKGDVIRDPKGPGHEIRLDVTLGPGQIEDLLELGTKSQRPLLTGATEMHTNLYLPARGGKVMDKIRLEGSFAVLNAHFTESEFQSKIAQLSLRGLGKAKEAKELGQAQKNGDPASGSDVASTMRGDFSFGDGKIAMKDLDFSVPGAEIALQGVYTMESQQLDFHGSARFDAKLSQMVTGWKSLLLRPVDPFFSNHNRTDIPINVTGTRSHPHVGLDLGSKNHPDEASLP